MGHVKPAKTPVQFMPALAPFGKANVNICQPCGFFFLFNFFLKLHLCHMAFSGESDFR